MELGDAGKGGEVLEDGGAMAGNERVGGGWLGERKSQPYSYSSYDVFHNCKIVIVRTLLLYILSTE